METAWNFRNTWVQVTKLPLKNFGFYGFLTIGMFSGSSENTRDLGKSLAYGFFFSSLGIFCPRDSGFFLIPGLLSPGFSRNPRHLCKILGIFFGIFYLRDILGIPYPLDQNFFRWMGYPEKKSTLQVTIFSKYKKLL